MAQTLTVIIQPADQADANISQHHRNHHGHPRHLQHASLYPGLDYNWVESVTINSSNLYNSFYHTNSVGPDAIKDDSYLYDDYGDDAGSDPGGGVGGAGDGQQPLYTQVIIVLMYVLIIIIAVGGNLLFSYVIVMRARMPSVTNLFLLNLAVSDLMKAIICNPFTFMANLIWLYWPYGEFLCPVVTYIQVVTVFLSAFTLVAMSVDRYVAILRPMRPKMTRRAFATIMTVIWILSFAAPLPTALTSRVTYNRMEGEGEEVNATNVNLTSTLVSNTSRLINNISSGSINEVFNKLGVKNQISFSANDTGSIGSLDHTPANESSPLKQPYKTADAGLIVDAKGLCLEVFENEQNRYYYSVAIMMLQYFVPLAVITVTNCHIGYIVWIKKTPGEAEADRDRRMAASKRRLVKMIIIVVVIYAVCWLPLHVITLIGDHNPDIYSLPHMNVVWLCAHWLAMSHSCYNPIVYFSLNTTFRRNLKRMMVICRTSVHRHYRNRKRRRGGRYDGKRNNNNGGGGISHAGSASSLQNFGHMTRAASGGGDWTVSTAEDFCDEETEFVMENLKPSPARSVSSVRSNGRVNCQVMTFPGNGNCGISSSSSIGKKASQKNSVEWNGYKGCKHRGKDAFV